MNYSARKEGNYDWERVSGLLKARENAEKQAIKAMQKAQKSAGRTRRSQKTYTAEEIMADYDKWVKVQEAQKFLDSRTPTNLSAEEIMADYDKWLANQKAAQSQAAPITPVLKKQTQRQAQEPAQEIPVLKDNRVFNAQDAQKRQAEEAQKKRVFNEKDAQKRQAEQEKIVPKKTDAQDYPDIVKELAQKNNIPVSEAQKQYEAITGQTINKADKTKLASANVVKKLSEQEKIDGWLDPSHKMTKDERKDAQKIVKEFNKKYGSQGQLVRSDEEKAQAAKIAALDNKSRAAGSFAAGKMRPILNATNMAQKGADYLLGGSAELGAGMIDDLAGTDLAEKVHNARETLKEEQKKQNAFLREQYQNAQAQNGLAYGAGNFLGSAELYALTNPAFDALGASAGLGAAGKFVGNQIGQNVQDIVLDTIPEYMADLESGMSPEEARKKALMGLGFNAAGNLAMGAASELLPALKMNNAAQAQKANDLVDYGRNVLAPIAEDIDNVARKTDLPVMPKPEPQNIPNAAKMAEDIVTGADGRKTVEQLVEDQAKAAQNIEDLAKQIPKQESAQDLGHQLAEKYAASFQGIDTYGYMDELDAVDSGVEQMARDINEGKDLTQYIDALEDYVDEVELPEDKAEIENLIKELSSLNQKAAPVDNIRVGRSELVDRIVDQNLSGDPDRRVMGNLLAEVETKYRNGELNLSYEDWDNLLKNADQYAKNRDPKAVNAINDILLKAGGEEAAPKLSQIVTDPMMEDTVLRFESLEDQIRRVLHNADYSGNEKLVKEAGDIEKYLDEYKQAIIDKDVEKASRVAKDLSNARKRFNTAAKNIEGYNGEFNTKAMGTAIDSPAHYMRERIGYGDTDIDLPDMPPEQRYAHPKGTTWESYQAEREAAGDIPQNVTADDNVSTNRITELDERIAQIDERLKQYDTPKQRPEEAAYRAQLRALDEQIQNIENNGGVTVEVNGIERRLDRTSADRILSDLKVQREQVRRNLEDLSSVDIEDAISGNNRKMLEDARAKLVAERDSLNGAGGEPPVNGGTPKDITPPTNPPKTPGGSGGGTVPPEDIEVPEGGRISKARTNTYERLGWGDAMPREEYKYKVYSEAEQNADAISRYQGNADVARTLLDKDLKDFDEADVKAAFSKMQELMDQGDPESLRIANMLGKKSAAAQRQGGRVVQASAEFTRNTAAGALQDANRAQDDLVLQPWISRNKKQAEGNKRIAKALADMGNTELGKKNAPVLTHEQVKQGVLDELKKEFASVEDVFNDNDIEYLARLAEDKTVPVWKITDEIEHKLKHGTWYTLDESLPEKAVKNNQLARMLDEATGIAKESKEKPEQTIGNLLTGIKNTLNDESIGVADQFNDDDYYFIAKMIEEKVPRWQIVDELRHKLDHGTWYNLDESIPVKQPTNKKLQNALDSLVTEQVRAEKEAPSLQQITEEVRNTLAKESADLGIEFTDDDANYIANLINNGATKTELTDALNMKMATGTFGISDETLRQVNDIFKEISHYDPNSKRFVEGQAKAYELLANEILPDATAAEKFAAWRYIAMLGNSKTMLRNHIGNATFNVVTGISNDIAAIAEAGIDRALKKKGGIQRTKSLLNITKEQDRNLIKAAWDDADASSYRQMVGSKYEKMNADSLRQHKSVFKSKLAQLYEKATDKGISDFAAMKTKFSTSLAGYLKANGYGTDIFKAEDELARLKNFGKDRLLSDAERTRIEELTKDIGVLDKAREYALKQAEYATFHEDNKVAEMLTRWSRMSKEEGTGLGHLIIEGLVPFKKTPANVLRSGFEYSPLGAIDSIRKTGKLAYENTGKRAGNLADTYINKKGKEVSKTLAADVIDSWSKTLTGTGLAALGYFLANKGILHLSESDTKYQDELEGHQNYAIEINGHSYTIDWAAPSIMPIMIGAELQKLWGATGKDDADFYNNIDKYFSIAGRIADPLIETSMLSGVKDSLESAANYARNNEVLSIPSMLMYNTATGYLSQGIPTIAGQIARTVDPTRRSSYTDKEGILGVVDKQLKKQMNKIPWLSMMNNPYVDTYGREQNNSPVENPLARLAYQALSPGYLQKIEETDADKISRNAYAISGEKNTLPEWQSGLKIGGERVDPDTYTQYAKTYGQANKSIRDALAGDPWFTSQDEATKAEIVGDVNSIANNVGKAAVDPEFTTKSKAYEAYSTGGIPSLIDYYREQQAKAVSKEAGLSVNSNAAKSIQKDILNGDEEAAAQKTDAIEYLKSVGLGKPGPAATYCVAHDTISGLTPETFAKTYKEMDVDNSQGLKKDEVVSYMNKHKFSQAEGLQIFKAYGKSTWKIPTLKNGTWK